MLPVTSRTSACPPTIESCSSRAPASPGAPRRSPSAPSARRPCPLSSVTFGPIAPTDHNAGSIRTGSTISAPSTVADGSTPPYPVSSRWPLVSKSVSGLPGVPPTLDRSGDQLRPLVDHVLEGISQVVLARRAGIGGQRVPNTLEEEFVITDVVQTDVGQLGDRL